MEVRGARAWLVELCEASSSAAAYTALMLEAGSGHLCAGSISRHLSLVVYQYMVPNGKE